MSTPGPYVPILSGATWVKSSHSTNNGSCVEVSHGTTWTKSSYSTNNGACVELAHGPAWVAVRDSKRPDGPAIVLAPAALGALVHAVQG